MYQVTDLTLYDKCSNSIITVFFHQAELLSVIDKHASLYSDSHMNGLSELMVWLDAVSAATSQGPVMIVGTFGDVVTDQVGAMWQGAGNHRCLMR